MSLRLLPLCAALAACSPGGARVDKPIDSGPTGSPVTGATTGTSTGTTTGTSTGTTSQIFDCSTVPDTPLGDVILDAPRGYNDLVFDLDGEMIGHDNTTDAFLRASDGQTAVVLAPENTTVYKMGLLSTGEFVAATSDRGIIKVTPAGSITTLLPDFQAYGLAVAPDDSIYVASNYTAGIEGIVRIDPITGDWEVLETLGETPRAIAFSRDFSVLYIGTTNGGRVLRLPLDANGDPTAAAELLVTVPEAWHDTMEVDACGNLYVGSVFSTSLYRVNADLSVITLIQWSGGFNGPYGHGLEWGSALGGWNERAVYITHPYIGSRVSEVDLGVPGQAWQGTALGGVTL